MIKFILEKSKIRIISNHNDEIREVFSVKDKEVEFKKKFNNKKFLKSRIYCITPTGLFEYGMFYDILSHVKQRYPDIEVSIDNSIYKVVKPGLDTTIYDELSLKLRDYQYEACEKCIQYGRGVLKMGTGAGKTLTICSLISSLFIKNSNMKVLLVVPDLSLVNQTYKDFEEYNAPFKYTRWTGKLTPDITSNVIIANIGILQRQFEVYPWLVDIDLLVVDECHKLKKGNKVVKLVTSIKTNNKIGLTGTLPPEKPDEWNLKGVIGPVIYNKDSYSLRLEQYLTNVKVNIVKIKYKDKPLYKRGDNNFKYELDFLYLNNFRNNIIKGVCDKFSNNILILVNHLSHGDELYSVLHSLDKEVYFIKGEVDVEEREKIKNIMEKQSNVICIAISAIFSTGINIKNIHMIVFAAGGKSFIRTIQSVGRGLRKHSTKDRLNIIDIGDQTTYGIKHLEKRKEIYTKEKILFTETICNEVDNV